MHTSLVIDRISEQVGRIEGANDVKPELVADVEGGGGLQGQAGAERRSGRHLLHFGFGNLADHRRGRGLVRIARRSVGIPVRTRRDGYRNAAALTIDANQMVCSTRVGGVNVRTEDAVGRGGRDFLEFKINRLAIAGQSDLDPVTGVEGHGLIVE